MVLWCLGSATSEPGGLNEPAIETPRDSGQVSPSLLRVAAPVPVAIGDPAMDFFSDQVGAR